MQTQLEITNMVYCDFVETRFKEFSSREEYLESSIEHKGLTLYFISRDDKASIFIHMPLDMESESSWLESIQSEYKEYILYETTYWYLDEFSCTIVERNAIWFEACIPIIEEAWQIVEKERKEGFEHRAPQKRTIENEQKKESLCLIKLDENGMVLSKQPL